MSFLTEIPKLLSTGLTTVAMETIVAQEFVATPHWNGKNFRLTIRKAAHERDVKASHDGIATIALQLLSTVLGAGQAAQPVTLLDVYPSYKGVDLEIKLELLPLVALVATGAGSG